MRLGFFTEHFENMVFKNESDAVAKKPSKVVLLICNMTGNVKKMSLAVGSSKKTSF